uniref:Importin-11 n=1 Tax=Cacopsylla melanoneura TaxID=428564 RepID=A0A8D8V4U8_9HEMI
MNEQAYSLVLETLQQASSQNPEILKPAEEKLKSWNTEPGFHLYLVNILKNRNIDNTVRWLGVLCLKNGVDRYWRKGAPNEIENSEKESLRQILINDFQEPIPQIELQVAVIISKIARFDWPNEWPQLVPTLLSAVQDKDSRTQDGALVTWQHVVKALSSKRLCGDRKLFQDLTRDLFPFMIELYMLHLKLFLTGATDNSHLRRCLSCVKILRKLLVFGFKKPDESPHVRQFVSDVFPQITTVLQLETHPSIDKCLLNKYIVNLIKVPLQYHEHHPLSFVLFLNQSLEFCVSLAFNQQANSWQSLANSNEKLLMLTLNFFKNIILCKEYTTPLTIKTTGKVFGSPETQQADGILKQFFSQQLLEHLTLTLVTQYMPLTQSELNTWDEDPETSLTDEAGESWKYSIRPCIETLFLTIFHKHSSLLIPLLLSLLKEYRPPASPSDMQRILVKDAVYNAIGLAAFDLYDEINVDEWFQSSLRQELAMKHNNYRIIRKRVVWLLGNWSNVKFSSELRPLLYEELLPLMGPEEDLVVRLSACKAFKMCVDDFEFNTEQFLPFVHIYFNTLYKLLCDAKECDNKMHVLNVCSFLIERMGSSIADFADNIFESLPLLWAQSEEHNLLRAAIVNTLTHLTAASGKVHSIVPQVVKYCTDIEQEQCVYMLEDGLELWMRALYHSQTLSPALDQLYPSLFNVIRDISEHHAPCSKILRAYILLDPGSFYSNKVSPTAALLCDLLPSLRLEGFTNLTKCLELCVRVVPSPPLGPLHPILCMLINFLLEDTDHTYWFKQSLILCILSRIILLDTSYFLSLVQEAALRNNTSYESMLVTLLDDMLVKTRLVTQPQRRKVIGLAYASLLTCKSVIILNKFSSIIEQVTEIFNDVMRMAAQGNEFEDAFASDPLDSSPIFFNEHSRHDERKKELTKFDPVYTVHMNQFVQTKLSEVCSQVGAETFASLVSSVDSEVLKNLQDYVSI